MSRTKDVWAFKEGAIIRVDGHVWQLINYLPKRQGYEVLPLDFESHKYSFFAELYLQQWAKLKVNGKWVESKVISCEICSKQQGTRIWHQPPRCKKPKEMEIKETYDLEID